MARQQQTHDLRPKARFAGKQLGKYSVGARLAAGGTASVYLARLAGPHNFERLVALKIIHDHLVEEREFVDMFLDEANLAARLADPHVVHVYELASDDDQLFLAMEYLHGQPLSRLYERAAELGMRLPADLVAWIGARAASGLAHAHALQGDDGEPLGLVHRDVSPHNVFITYDGQVKVVDFGIARAAGRIAKTALGQLKGKFGYMSPEQALGHDFDHRADLFALGATLYEAAVGRRLFKGEDEVDTLRMVVEGTVPDPRDEFPDFPEPLLKILRKALSTNPEDRFASGEEMARELDEFVSQVGTTEHKQTLTITTTELFADEKATQERAIADLRAGSPQAERDQSQSSDGSDETVIATQLAARRASPKSRGSWAIGAVGVVVFGGVVAAVAWPGAEARAPASELRAVSAAAPEPPAKPARVTLDIELQPPVQATLELDGQILDDARATIDRGEEAVTLVVRAEGFEEAKLEVIPDRDRSVLVPLRERPAAKPKATRRGAAPVPPVPRGASPPARSRPASPKSPAKPAPPKVITENPF